LFPASFFRQNAVWRRSQIDRGECSGYGCRAMIVPIAKIQVRRDEDGVFIAKSDLLPGCHAHGQDRGEAILRFQQAAQAHLEALLETGRPIPPAFRDKFVLAA
jgi:predicted RNase H-like HicB family nuclease